MVLGDEGLLNSAPIGGAAVDRTAGVGATHHGVDGRAGAAQGIAVLVWVAFVRNRTRIRQLEPTWVIVEGVASHGFGAVTTPAGPDGETGTAGPSRPWVGR